MANLLRKFHIIFGRLRFFVRTSFLKIMHRKQIYSKSGGWMASQVEILISESGRIKLGYCEISSGCKLAVEKMSLLHISDGVFFNRNCTIVSKSGVSIGANTLFGESVKIFDHDHVHVPKLEKSLFLSKPITIGSDCWFGSNVVILKGVSIGDNVTVGANCVVAKDIPSNTVLKADFVYSERKK